MLNSKTAKKFQKVHKKPLNLFKGFDSSITFSIFDTYVEFAYKWWILYFGSEKHFLHTSELKVSYIQYTSQLTRTWLWTYSYEIKIANNSTRSSADTLSKGRIVQEKTFDGILVGDTSLHTIVDIMGKMNENEREKNWRNVFSLLLCIERYTAREAKEKVSTSIDFCCCQSDSLHRVYCGEKKE